MKLFDQFCFVDGTVNEGLTEELSAFYVLECFKKEHRSIVVVTANLYDANKFFKVISRYSSDVYLFPMDDFFTSVALAVSPELKLKRLETLDKISNKPGIVVTNLMGYLKFLPSKKEQEKLKIELKSGMSIARDELVSQFEKLGYLRDSMVTSTGEYAVRGFVLDIFLMEEDLPIRIEFFGDEIESIRYFNPETQRTTEEISSIVCRPIEEISTQEDSSLLEYLDEATVLFIEYPQIKVSYEKLLEESEFYNKEQGTANKKHFFSFFDLHPIKILYLNHVT